MVTLGRVLLWTVVLLAPGGFLLVPVLAAAELNGSRRGAAPQNLREVFQKLALTSRHAFARLQRYWTNS